MKVNPQLIPHELKSIPRWVVWKLVEKGGKTTKIPYCGFSPNRKAKVNDEKTWCLFDVALATYLEGKADGVGIIFHDSDELYGIDLDEAYDPKTKKWNEIAKKILEQCQGTYAEFSQSGQGAHIYAFGQLNGLAGRRKGKVEIYSHGRMFIVTGNQIDGHTANVTKQAKIIAWLSEHIFKPSRNGKVKQPVQQLSYLPNLGLSGSELLEKARNSTNGKEFCALYDYGEISGYGNDHSSADLALCNMLAFWSGGDLMQMDLLFRGSALMRPKWNEKHSADGSTYGEMTLRKALQSTTNRYDPNYQLEQIPGLNYSITNQRNLQRESQPQFLMPMSFLQDNNVLYSLTQLKTMMKVTPVYNGHFTVVATGRDQETLEETLTVEFKLRGTLTQVTAPRAELATKKGVIQYLARRGANVHEQNAKLLSAFIVEYASLNDALLPGVITTTHYGNTGVGIVGPSWFVGEKAAYNGPVNISIHEDKLAYKDSLITALSWQNAWPLHLALGLSVIAPIIKHIKTRRNPVIWLSGRSNSG